MNKFTHKLLSLGMAAAMVGTLSVPAFAKEEEKVVPTEPITKTITFKTTDKDFSTDEFESYLNENEWYYTLDNIEYEEDSKGEYIVEKTIVLTDTEANKYSEGSTFTLEGKEYTVKTVNVTESVITNRVSDLSWEVRLGAFVGEPTAPKTLKTTYTDLYSDRTFEIDAELREIKAPEASWREDIEVPIMVYGMDCEYYVLEGDINISSDSPLEDMKENQAAILKNAGLDAENYELLNFEWTSGVYENDEGTLCRQAIAYGKRLAADYTAIYTKDNVKLPDCKGYAYEITYDELQEGMTEYTVTATATYKPEIVIEDETPLLFFDSVGQAAVASSFLLFALVGLWLIYLLYSRRQNKKVEEKFERGNS